MVQYKIVIHHLQVKELLEFFTTYQASVPKVLESLQGIVALQEGMHGNEARVGACCDLWSVNVHLKPQFLNPIPLNPPNGPCPLLRD